MMTNRMGAVAALMVAVAAFPAAAQQDDGAMPPITGALPPPPSRTAQAVAVLAPYRHDDLLWENDLTAHRIYGHALEAVEPPSGSGIDSWGKNVRWPFADRQLRTGDQHGYHGEGIDFYNVGTTRGAGGLGIWYDNKLWTSRNFVRHRIAANGGRAADFTVDYAPWPVDIDRKVWETRRFTLPLGTYFTRMISTLSSDKSTPLTVAIGIGKRTTGSGAGEMTIDRARGMMAWWGPVDGDHGRMGIAIRVDPAAIADIRADADNQLVLLRVTPGRPFVYYSGSVWDKGGRIRTRAAWDAAVAAEPVDFTVPGDMK